MLRSQFQKLCLDSDKTKYTSASRKRVTHNGARHKGALRPRDKEGEQTIFRLRVAFNLLKIISLKSLPYFDSTYDVIRVIWWTVQVVHSSLNLEHTDTWQSRTQDWAVAMSFKSTRPPNRTILIFQIDHSLINRRPCNVAETLNVEQIC